jgi:1-acyl-sn-glycerol-3-phosphate acyltransferase
MTATAELELRRQLPGLEPERQVTDWGRSERVDRLVDVTLSHFLYHYWLRVEVEGVENVPSHGGALIVANRAGQLRLDAAMIGKALREEHRAPRPLHMAGPAGLRDVPGLGMLATKLGAVTEHPANLQRLLSDEGQLVLLFPEARQDEVKPLSSRYRLRSFDRVEIIRVAVEAQVPIVPVAVVGSEESTPLLSGLGPLGRLTRLRVGLPLPLPARFRLRFLRPVRTDRLGEKHGGELPPWSELSQLTEDIRALIQENLYEMVAARRSVWLG